MSTFIHFFSYTGYAQRPRAVIPPLFFFVSVNELFFLLLCPFVYVCILVAQSVWQSCIRTGSRHIFRSFILAFQCLQYMDYRTSSCIFLTLSCMRDKHIIWLKLSFKSFYLYTQSCNIQFFFFLFSKCIMLSGETKTSVLTDKLFAASP